MIYRIDKRANQLNYDVTTWVNESLIQAKKKLRKEKGTKNFYLRYFKKERWTVSKTMTETNLSTQVATSNMAKKRKDITNKNMVVWRTDTWKGWMTILSN